MSSEVARTIGIKHAGQGIAEIGTHAIGYSAGERLVLSLDERKLVDEASRRVEGPVVAQWTDDDSLT